MSRRYPALGVTAVLLAGVFLFSPPVAAQDATQIFENLRVLPVDISRPELNAIMLGNLRGLGLRRLQGQGCLYCHVGNMEQPRESWNYASDDKLAKRKARVMMAMVRDINSQHLSQLEERLDSSLEVTCYTCHAGRTDPRPLTTILHEAYTAGGIDSLDLRYRALRARYFAADAYDFRPTVLPGLAAFLADRDAMDDAVAIAQINVDVYPDNAVAKRRWVEFYLERIIKAENVTTALSAFDRMTPDLSPSVLTPGLLDALGWRLMRRDREDDAVAILESNLERFPDQYIPIESMAFVRESQGDLEAATGMLESWLERNPDHERARRLLINMRGG